MKSYKKFLIFIICMVLAGFLGSIFVIRRYVSPGVDMVLLNDIARTAEENLDHIDRLQEYDFGADYVIFGPDGRAVFSSVGFDPAGADVPGGYSEALQNRYPCMAIEEDGKYYGSVAILKNQWEEYSKYSRSSLGALFLSGLCMIAVLVLWGVYVDHSIVKPFRRMEKFAGEVAAGNLDAPLKMEENNMFGIFTESFDLMRVELAKAKETEIRLKRQEKELIATLSHDLRTPVTGIKVTTELMKAQTDDPGNLEKLDHIYKKAEQINTLVNDLFTSSLQDLGEMSVSLSEENSAVLHEYVSRCDDRKLAAEDPVPECLIRIDPRRMEQIIGNVIVNSYKYANTRIDISYAFVEGYLKMSIRDYGPGVPEEELSLVTNKFYRSSSSKEGTEDGSGLGLYIAKALIEKMEGGIRCLNGKPGFEIWLLIPLA